MTALISISNLTKTYHDKKVVNNVDLTVNAGQILGLVGPNGAGKTTSLQAVLGLTDFQGDVSVLGYDPTTQRTAMLNDVA